MFIRPQCRKNETDKKLHQYFEIRINTDRRLKMASKSALHSSHQVNESQIAQYLFYVILYNNNSFQVFIVALCFNGSSHTKEVHWLQVQDVWRPRQMIILFSSLRSTYRINKVLEVYGITLLDNFSNKFHDHNTYITYYKYIHHILDHTCIPELNSNT